MCSVLEETLDLVKEKCPFALEEISVEDVVIGIFFTGVRLSTGPAGVAFTPAGEIPEAVCYPTSAARMPAAGRLGNRPVLEILPYALDCNVLKSAIGVATLNALSQTILESEDPVGFSRVEDTDGFDLRNISAHDGYKTVFSWQEIFSTAVGGGVMVLLERDGEPLDRDKGQLELISTED